jgi:hypothetical protein
MRRLDTRWIIEKRERFKSETLRRAGGECQASDPNHDGPLQAHHVVTQSALKRLARTLKFTDGERARLLWDPDNGMALCERHHTRHTGAVERIPYDDVPPAARLFANAWRLDYLIDRYYPKENSDAA